MTNNANLNGSEPTAKQFIVNTSGAILSVSQNGNGGEPLLLLHGGPGVPDYMQTSTAPLLPDLRCISFDQRGVGKSKCLDGKYDLDSYLEDMESIRTSLEIQSWHVLGHSWGGLLAQAYASAHSNRVKSLALVSSSLGVGKDWKRTKRESFRIEHARAGLASNLRVFAYGSGLIVPGPIGSWAMRHVMTETWHDYFLDPRAAPDPDPAWLSGCSPVAMMRTDRAVSGANPDVLNGLSRYEEPVLIVYGAYDILDTGVDIVRRRFPDAVQVTIENSGHLPWLQNPAAYQQILLQFYKHLGPV
jgi:proline iminopeptidase